MKIFCVLALSGSAAVAQDAGQAFLDGVSDLDVSACQALADSIPGMDDTGLSEEALGLLSAAVREQCFRTALLNEREELGGPAAASRGKGPSETQAPKETDRRIQDLDQDIRARGRASENLMRAAMAADSGVQNDLLRRLLGQDPVPKG